MVRKPGAPPGTLWADSTAPKPLIRALSYGPDRCQDEIIEDLSRLQALRRASPVLWIDVEGLGDTQIVERLGAIFRIHPLALEDVTSLHQRSKIERYGEVLFVVARMVTIHDAFDTEQLSLFLGSDFVITFQEKPGDPLEPIRDRIKRSNGRIRHMLADYLAYAILDVTTDGYFPVLEKLGEQLEALETEILAKPSRQSLMTLHRIKTDLRLMRRAIWPQREMLSSLSRDFRERFAEETRIHLHDVYDHTIELMDLIETHRDTAASFMDIYLSSMSNRMNEIMKVLTIISTIFIPLTFIVGVYGMNFDAHTSPWNMPELRWYWGYPAVLGCMTSIAIAMLFFFRHKGWLGSNARD